MHEWWEYCVVILVSFVCFYGGGIAFLHFGGKAIITSLEQLLLMLVKDRKDLEE